MKQNTQLAEIQVSYSPHILEDYQITSNRKAYELLLENWDENTLQMQEEVKVLLLNRNNKVLGIYPLAKGGMTECTIDIRLILSVALKTLATGIILAHNHPAGSLKPSTDDLKLTNKLKESCKLFDIILLDHLILAKSGYYSFAEEGLL